MIFVLPSKDFIFLHFHVRPKSWKSHIVAVPTCNFRGRRGCFRGPTISEIGLGVRVYSWYVLSSFKGLPWTIGRAFKAKRRRSCECFCDEPLWVVTSTTSSSRTRTVIQLPLHRLTIVWVGVVQDNSRQF